MERAATPRLRRLRGVQLRLAAVLCTIAVHPRGAHSFGVCSYRGRGGGAAAAGHRLHPEVGNIPGSEQRSSYLGSSDLRWRRATRDRR